MTIDLSTLEIEPPKERVPTPEQQAILDAVRTTEDNLLVEALAGAAKTTTLEMIANTIRNKPIMAIAFNKRIAEEMSKRLHALVKCQTLNAVGHRAWAQGLGRNITLNADKMYDIFKGETDSLEGEDRWALKETFAETLQCLKKAKALGYIPPKLYSNVQHIYKDRDDFYDMLELDVGCLLGDLERFLIDKCIDRSIKQSFDGVIDFDDQIFMPTMFHGVFPKFPLTLCDEVQDFSVLNQLMIAKMVEGRRIIAVGDPYQSIYAFRGADKNAMQALQSRFNMKTMTLSVSFRCPKAIVKLAQRRAPHMEYPPWAKEGSIRTLDEWKISDIPEGAFVICRNNAPLFYLALQFLKKGRGVNLVGSQLSKGLIRILKKLGDNNDRQDKVIEALDKWKVSMLKKAKTETKQMIVEEKAECLLVFINAGQKLAEMVAYAEAVFASKGSTSLMTGHKSKGLENENIFHLDSHLVNPPWIADRPHLVEQELNLQYVIDTRSKENYTYIYTEGLDS
jgi:superfamily I DNA/RNA helicase